ncbi:hypothetical protein LguiB_017318 [Lonicera macranthoides]
MAVDEFKLHVLFLPYFTPSHMIPFVDVARLFAARGVIVTIITTPCNARLFQDSVDLEVNAGHKITIHTLNLPSAEVGLPEGIENFNTITSSDMPAKVYQGFAMLQQPMEQLIRDLSPDCLFSDLSYPWTVDLADELGIPRLLFDPSSFLAHCVIDSMTKYAPHVNIKSDSESFLIPGLPDKIKMKGSMIEDHVKAESQYGEIVKEIEASKLRSFGFVHNSFYELEPAYADHYRKIKGRKTFHVGPVYHFSNRDSISNKYHECLNWLDTQGPNSVLYVAFGSLVRFPDSQLVEIAHGLEASGHNFIWVVRNREKKKENESWLPEGFEERITKGDKGMIVRDWAPQSKILNHPSIGGFMTHCGWNSILEASTMGVPLITWPLFSEQFYNEMIIAINGMGVRVGSDIWHPWFEITAPTVGREKIKAAIMRLMGDSEEAEKIRKRAKEMAVMAKKAVAEANFRAPRLIFVRTTPGIDIGSFKSTLPLGQEALINLTDRQTI